LKVKDYSTKKETHLACPECGYDLGYSNNEKTLKQNSPSY
jgi:DNA-directed RNA polymerase subunit RPC12/RpoP